MPECIVRDRDGREVARVPVIPAISLLLALGRAGVDVPTGCGGKAHCGLCRVTFLSGIEKAAAPRDAELVFRRTHPLPDDVRLACQTYLLGAAEIMVGMRRDPSVDGSPADGHGLPKK